MAEDLTVLNDVSETLKELIEDNISELPPNSVVFESPAETQKSGTTGLSLFLYQIVENVDLKNQEMSIVDPQKLRYPPMTVDLRYMITPFAQTRQTEQIILSKVMRVFHDNSILSGPQVKDSLKESGSNELRLIFSPISLEHLNNLWGTFRDTPYKLSVSYLVTPIVIQSSRIIETSRVISKESTFMNKNRS